MPIYKLNGDVYDIPQEKQGEFESQFPDAFISYTAGADQYDIPVSKRDDFLKDFPDAQLYSMSTPEAPEAPVEDPLASAGVPMFDDEPQAQPQAERGFRAGARESWKGMKAGFQNLWGETANLFTESSQNSVNALNELNDMVRQGKDVSAEVEDAWTDTGRELRTGAMEFLPGWMIKGWKSRVLDKAEKQKVLNDIRETLAEAGGDVDKARMLLEQRAQDQSYGDVQMAKAAEKFADVKPTEGFGAWVGSNIIQMIPSASALIVGGLTKSPAAAKAIGMIGMGGMTASTAGSSMYEARESGASDTETWKVGIVDGMIEYLTEKLPFDRYTSRIMGKVKGEVAQDLFSALRANKAARTELENLLKKANERLGGKLFSKKNLKDYIADMMAEGASEFSAEALQTMTSMMYEEPENYPTINEILTNGWEGAKAGFFMGAVLGGASKTMEHTQNRNRRMEKGSVDVALVDFGDGEKDVVEVVEYDDKSNTAVVMRDGSFETVSGDAISDGYRFSFDEFEKARLREMEDEAIVSGNVTDGQIQGLEEAISKDIEDIRALAPDMSENEISAVLQSEMSVDPDTPLGAAVAKYQEDVTRHEELVAAKSDADAARKEAVRSEIETAVGQRFWVQESGEDDGSGIVPVSETVEEVVYADGRIGYVVGSDDAGNLTMVFTDGTKGFSSRAEIVEKENSGEILSNTVMGLDDYLAIKMDIEEVTREEVRMQKDHALRVEEMIANHPQGTVINVGTEEAKVEVPIIAPPTKDGVIVQMPDGTTPMLTWEDVAHAEKTEITPRTNAQINQSIVDEYRVAYTPAVPTAQSQPMQQKDEQVKMTSPANPLPLKADGTVDQTALWNKDPERWAQWNDEQRQDGGANTLAYVNGAIAKEQAKIAELQAAYTEESDFDRRDALEKEMTDTRARVERLGAIRRGYIATAEAATAPVAETQPGSTLTARMASEMTPQELNDLDESYDIILSQTRVPEEKARLLQEYLDRIAEGSTPIKVLTRDNYEDVMRAAGCPEADIAAVGVAMANLPKGQAIAGFASGGKIFAMADSMPTIEEARITYVHERQHLINSADRVSLSRMVSLLGTHERALEVLKLFVGEDGVLEYKHKTIVGLADEIIARCMEIAYTTEEFSVDLQSKGLSDSVISIIEEINNGQRNNKSLSAARRSAYVGISQQGNNKEESGDSGQVSGGVLGEQRYRSSRLSQEGTGDGSKREGAEVISEEQLNAPNSGTAQQITAADGEVLADTDGKGGVRFSIRTWNEGGRDYLAAWLANDTTLTEEEKADILARMDEFYKNALLYSDTYAPFGTWSDAGVRYDNNGNPLMSVIKANGDYAMNLDFSLVCKKRRPLNRLLRTLVNRNAFATYTLRERELAEINWILQEHGFEVACALCFVDSKRYRVTGVADVFAALYNRLVKSLAPEGVQIAHFNYNENPNVEVVENGLDTMSDDQLNWDRFDRMLSAYKPGSVEHKVAQYLREHPEARKLVDATDFIEAEGFESVKENNPDLLKFYNMKKGTGGPKASFGDVQYLNDILKKEKSFDAEKAYAVGGVRLQSFSDFVPHMYFDYMQLFAELAAKKLPLHAYTKEVLFAKIFGLTGAKINMSLVPAVVEGGVAPGLDAEGNYAWADPVTDAEGNVIQQGQSFPYDEAMAIQHAEGYSKNCGVIAVGISDAHIEKMLDDPNIPFIIPYHKSSLNAIVARMTNIDQYKDYTNVQNTRKASGSKLDKGTKDFNFNEYLHGLGESGTPQQAAQAYLDWCRENNYKPKFSQFAYHPNYYKLLQDFNTIDLATGEYAPQGAVTMTFPTEQSAFGNVETLIQQGLQEDAELEEKMEQEIDGIADQVLARLEEISKEPKMSEKQQAKKMAELADERTAKIKAKAKGPIDLVEEARKADIRHRVAAGETLVPGHKKGQPMLSETEMMADAVSFRITKNTRATIESWFEKAGVEEEFTQSAINYLDSVFENATEQLCAAKWYLNGKINLPNDDVYKVRDAVKVAKKNKVDALLYDSPMDIIYQFGKPNVKQKPINPDTVPTLKNKKEVPGTDIVIYDVEESEESRKNMREIINTHYGKNASPWCVLQGNEFGELTAEAKERWEYYSAYPKQVAFKGGRLLAFSANSSKDIAWWDRLDKPYEGVPEMVKLNDKFNRRATSVINPKTGKQIRLADVHSRTEKDGYTIIRNWDGIAGPMLSAQKRKGDALIAKFNRYTEEDFATSLQYWFAGRPNGIDQVYTQDKTINFSPNGVLETYNTEGYRLAYNRNGRATWLITTKGSLIQEYGFDRKGKLVSFFSGTELITNRKRLAKVEVPAEYKALVGRNPRSFMAEAEQLIKEAGLAEAYEESSIRFRFVPRTDEQREQLFDAAKAHYGLTNNFNASGYMLPDGSLLDFSEANDGGDPNRRSLDHRDIEGLIMDEGKEYDSRYKYVIDFVSEGAIRMLPEYAGFQLSVPPTAEQKSKLMDYIYKHNGEVIMEITDENGSPRVYMEYNKRTSPSRIFRDMDGYFNEGVVPGIPPLRFRVSNENQAIFVSNAAKAVEGIKQEKATPEQWLKMIEKNGGLKAGEDKWMGLSDWLKASDKKTLTKQEVLDFINENMIVIEEAHYTADAESDAENTYAMIERILQEKFGNYIAEYYEQNNGEDDGLYGGDSYEYAMDKLREEMNDEFPYTIERSNSVVYLTFPYEETDDLQEWADKLGLKFAPQNPINDIRLGYTTDGLANKHEIALTIPTIEPWNVTDDTHFGDAGNGRAVAWIRFGETKTYAETEEGEEYKAFVINMLRRYHIDEEVKLNRFGTIVVPQELLDALTNKQFNELQRLKVASMEASDKTEQKVLVIDEIQSKRHQEGREKGYISTKVVEAKREAFEKASKPFFAYEQELREKYENESIGFIIDSELKQIITGEEYLKYDNLRKAYDDAWLDYRNPRYDAIPDAPFDKNWHELAMKRMLRFAAENGYDVIAWTKGDQQAERYNIGSYVSSIEMQEEYDGNRDFGFYMGDADEATTVTVDENGIVVSAEGHLSQAVGRPLADLVGKEMAVKMMQMEEYDVLEDTDLKVGNEGMKGFYDKMLPAFMNKYGKKWGVKVEDIELPNLENGLTMHSVPVTEEMKASVMEGQVMFRVRREDETPMEFTQQVINDCTSRYNEVAEVKVFPANEETAERFGFTMEEMQETGGTYLKDEDIIAIFALQDIKDSRIFENIFFHESIHKLAEFYPEFKKIGEWMWNNADVVGLQKIKNNVKKAYDQEWHHEEMLTYGIANAMSLGRVEQIESGIPEEYKGGFRQILNEIGYEPEKESRRDEGRVSESLRRGTAAMERKTDESGRSKKEEARTGELTAEERRIIGEYFPEFNKYEDVRYRISDVNTNPTEAQKKAGNYKMGHLRLDGYNITIENPKGSVRRGTDSKGNAWENTLNNDYGYIRGTEGVDGDHIDVYLSDNPTEGNVFVIDQVNPETGEFDEHKVMYGFNSAEEAREAYLANFSEGWNGLGTITEVSKDEFKKWIESSHRKTKPFSEYKSVRANEMQSTDESELRYRVVSDQETLDRLNSKPTIKVYRAMQLIDGKLYPPMSAKVDGELRQPIELGQWEEAEERPDLVDEKGRFKLDKGNKSSLKARYNPYFHTSPTPLNDQFSSAQTRPELVTVEVEVPESELTSGYKAEKAKDSVGKMEWKAGVVQSKLSGTRTVILSRWDKPVRIVPDSEVADVIVDMFEGRGITMPSNVVTPSLRAELEKRGVPFVETDNQGNPIEEVSFRVTGTPTDEVVANGLQLTPAQTAEVAANIFAALPEESRKKLTAGLNGNILGLKDAILQIPTSLAIKENWNEEDKQMADVVAEEMTKMAGEMTRPFSAEEGLWLLYNNLNKGTDLISLASRALVQRNLGFDAETIAMQEQAKEDVRFRTVGDATSNAQASLYNRGAVNVWTRLKESFVDMQASVEELVKAIEKRTGKVAQGFENILLALNQQSSKGLAAMESYTQKFLNPMFDEIRRIMNETDFKYEDIVRYVILKHGLERNNKLAQRDAKAHYQEIYDDIISKITGMTAAQKRTYLTNAQLKEGDAKAELATLQAVDMSSMTDEEKREHKKKLAAARKAVEEAEEYLKRAQKIASMTEQEAQDELDKIFEKIENGTDSVYKEMRKNDYSGISSMFYDQLGVNRGDFATEEEYQSALMMAKEDKYSTLADVEAAAEAEVKNFEGLVDTKELWKRINAATKETLRQQYEANMISKDQYDSLRNMFEYYVPLRGFKDNTAEDMYTYYRKPNSTGYTKPILGAEGRKTEAESPFGWIASMAGSAIASNVKNEAKLALYYFVSNRPENGIATISKTWFVDSGEVDERGKKIFKPAYPPFSEDLSSAEGKAQYEIWQANMKELQKKGQAYEAGQRLNLGNAVVNISDANKPEHIVNVKVGGKDYTIIINGNPRAAQAINGDLNIEGTAQDYSALFGPVLRWMSSVNTSYNPEFWITNMMRDMAFTMMAVNIKEDPAYRRKFSKNYRKAFKVISLVAKNEKGTIGDSYLEQQYKDFVKYGGVTGYTQIKDSETWEHEIENYLSSSDPESLKSGKVMRGMKSAFHAAHRFGESLEQVSRFAAFLTARETGKSINEAINDAKEITVNFNRKGSGKMITLEEAKYLTGKNGQPLTKPQQWMVVGLSSIAPLGRRFIMFFNAAIQGLNATYKLMKKNPKRFTGWALGYAAVGMMNAVLHAMLDDDDDYLDIPQYERRNSLMIGGNGAYFKWALPQEARAFYALGDLAVETVMGRNPHQNVIGEALKIGTEILPVNPSEGWKAFMPSVAIPAIELMLNEDYKGAPIYNEQKWLSEEEKERTAKWSSAYQGTGWTYVKIAQGLNFITGGDKHDAGFINLQPEKLEHLVQSAFGGTIRTADKFINTISAAIDPEEPMTVRQTPFLNRFLTINDERFKNVHVNDVFDYYKADAEHALTLEKQYIKDRDKDSLTKLRSSDEYQWAKIYGKYKKPLKAIQDKIKVADGTAEKKELMKQQDELKKRMIKEISEL